MADERRYEDWCDEEEFIPTTPEDIRMAQDIMTQGVLKKLLTLVKQGSEKEEVDIRVKDMLIDIACESEGEFVVYTIRIPDREPWYVQRLLEMDPTEEVETLTWISRTILDVAGA